MRLIGTLKGTCGYSSVEEEWELQILSILLILLKTPKLPQVFQPSRNVRSNWAGSLVGILILFITPPNPFPKRRQDRSLRPNDGQTSLSAQKLLINLDFPRRLHFFIATVAVATSHTVALGQCGTFITAFPSSEGFENAAVWVSGGTANDWAWGVPAHPNINTAGGGLKAWCVGGLSGTFYNNNERSWLESPCFDFSSLNTPRISFKIYWEVERQYDGMILQYSTDGGTTYNNVGAFGEAPDCNTQNWFNSSNITNLATGISPKHGWSGRAGSTVGSCQGGSGSNGWVTASHCLGMLANAPSVRFRFSFGAGSVCNNYDGIAIDDILIDEAPPVIAAFSGDCTGTTVDFINSSTTCPNLFSWNFGDPGSAQNTSSQENPSHTYADPGTYTITLTATDGCGASGTHTMDISVLGVTLATTPPTCGADNGSVEATISGANGAVNYLWSPGGATTQTLANVGAGTYTVTVSGVNSCPVTATATLTSSGTTLAVDVAHTDVSCAGLSDGTATATTVGGVAPFNFSWAPGSENSAAISNLAAGDYTCTVTDGQGCSAQATATVGAPAPFGITAGPDTAVCAGNAVLLQAEANGGTPGYTFNWLPDGPAVTPAATTTYTVVATDANGCQSAPETTVVTVSSSFTPSFTSTEITGCSPHCITFYPTPAGASDYLWDFGDGGSGILESPTYCYQTGGLFPVSLTVTDATGCTGTVTTPDYADIHATPTASFTPSRYVTTIDAPTVQLSNTSQNSTSWFWTFDQGDTAMQRSPSVTFPAVGCYTVALEASNDLGCRDTASVEICVEDAFLLFMPNAFTPNDDGINDVLLPKTSVRNPADFELKIFDRWGKQVFSTEDIYAGWDGGTTTSGIYIWKIWITDTDQNGHELVGHVALLR